MIAVVIGSAAGFVLGAMATVALRRVEWRNLQPEQEAGELSSADREAISAEFATHTASVRRELTRYANELADGDKHLRERLRRFEAGV